DAGVGVGGEPSETGSGVRTGSRLAQDFFFVKVEAQTAGGAVLYGSCHAVGNFGNQRSYIELTLDPRLEVRYLFRRRGMLQIVKCSAVGNSGDHRAQLQRGHGNTFAIRTHLAHAAEFFWNRFVGVFADLLAGYVVARELTQSIFVSVVSNFFETQFASQRLEVSVVGMRQGFGEIHAAAAAESHRSLL